MDVQLAEVVDGAVAVDPAVAAAVPAQRRAISYGTALWIARIGRVGALWLPISTIVLAHSASSWAALRTTVLFVLLWKLALRRSYADASITTWTTGAGVPAAVGSITGALLVSPFAAWMPGVQLGEIALLELTAAVFLASVAWETAVARSLAARRRILVVGAGGGGSRLLEEIALAPGLPFDVVGTVDDVETDQVAGVPVLGRVEELGEIVLARRPQIVVLADARISEDAFGHLVELGHIGFSVVGLPEFYEYAFGRLPLRSLTPLWFMNIVHLYRHPYSQVAKRAFDVGTALAVGLAVAPLLPLLVLLVRRSGPVVYRQVRLGEGGKPFVLFKFRTMRVDAELHGAVWAAERDPRVTRIGCLMRRSRLDELPQLWNVLRGDMSFVGPRPERPEFVAELEAEVPFWGRRHLVKPGITGWAQIRRGYTADAAGTGDKLSYDLWYLRHRSLVVDLAICAKTVWTLLSGLGAR